MKILITGGLGFIGSHFVRMRSKTHPGDKLVNLDALTYAGKQANLAGLRNPNYTFVKGNIGDRELVEKLFTQHAFDAVINFAAESHVDNSIAGPRIFVETNVTGVLNLLEAAKTHWQTNPDWQTSKRFMQISTDEVYGSLPVDQPDLKFREDTPLDPSSPYSASKTAADLLVISYGRTFGMPFLITRSSNNYGPNQDLEKFMPTMISRALANQKLPVYGDGQNVRDWLYVEDNCDAINTVFERAQPGKVYNIGGSNEQRNLDVAKALLKEVGRPESLLEFVQDRLGHDRRYAIDDRLIQADLGWKPKMHFAEGLKATVAWYREQLKKEVK